MTNTTCPHCGTKADWYPIPEINLERCPNCFATRETTKTTAKTPTEKTPPKDK
jgi:hypothetical protein